MTIRLVAAVLLSVVALPAQKITINVGTAAPEGSPWHQILQKTREDWARLSGGQITMRVYPSGVQGDEIEMTRKVRYGQLHAVGLSGVGLSHVEKGVGALQIPMLVDSYEEFDFVRDRIAPKLEALIEQRGFVVLQWSDVGWVRFFSKTPARTPDDIRKLKLFTSAGDPEGERLYKEFGLQVVPLAVTDMLTSLKTNLIQAFDVPPLFAMLDQSFGIAKNMIDVKWCALAGATLLNKKTWDGIPAAQRAELMKSARASAESQRASIRKMGEDAIGEMKRRGLVVAALTPAELARWRSEAEAAYSKIRGQVVPDSLFDEAIRLHAEFQAQRRSAPADSRSKRP